MKRFAALALICALIITTLTGCGQASVKQNDLPDAEFTGGEYGLSVAVLYNGESNDGVWEDTFSRLEQPLLLGLEADAVDVSGGYGLSGYDILYLDESIMTASGADTLRDEIVAFAENGKPYLPGGPHFSLSHSHALAAVLISDAPCGVDIEMIDARVAQKLAPRCLSAGEKDLDFFECWTKKECIVKRDGRALFAQPKQLDTTAPEYAGRFFTSRISDAAGRAYALSALCEDARHIKVWLPDK